MTVEQILPSPDCQMFDEDELSEYDDFDLGDEEGDGELLEDEELLDEEKNDWEEEM